jgi:hypothetical protein
MSSPPPRHAAPLGSAQLLLKGDDEPVFDPAEATAKRDPVAVERGRSESSTNAARLIVSHSDCWRII